MMTKPDFMKKQILFVTLQHGEKISFSNDNIVVKDKESQIRYQLTCYRIFALFIIGHTTLTTGIIQRSHKFGFPIILMTPSLRVIDIIGAKMEGNVLLRRQQYCYKDLNIGRHIIINKIVNQKSMLNKIRNKSPELKHAIKNLDIYIKALEDNSLSLDKIMGYEGMAAKTYFKFIFDNSIWSGRRPRIKSDYINATLDIGYTILFNLIDSLLSLYGFDKYCGVLHRQFYMRKSLVCDLVEPFRPLIDWQIRKSINLGKCKEEDFDIYNNRYSLKWKENPKYIKFLIEPIMTNKDAFFEYIQLYYRAFMKGSDIDKFPIFNVV